MSRSVYFPELLQFLTRSPWWRGVFAKAPSGIDIALRPPIPLPDLEGTGDHFHISAAVVKAVREWMSDRGLLVKPLDVEHAISAACVIGGEIPRDWLTPALQEWEDLPE